MRAAACYFRRPPGVTAASGRWRVCCAVLGRAPRRATHTVVGLTQNYVKPTHVTLRGTCYCYSWWGGVRDLPPPPPTHGAPTHPALPRPAPPTGEPRGASLRAKDPQHSHNVKGSKSWSLLTRFLTLYQCRRVIKCLEPTLVYYPRVPQFRPKEGKDQEKKQEEGSVNSENKLHADVVYIIFSIFSFSLDCHSITWTEQTKN